MAGRGIAIKKKKKMLGSLEGSLTPFKKNMWKFSFMGGGIQWIEASSSSSSREFHWRSKMICIFVETKGGTEVQWNLDIDHQTHYVSHKHIF